MYRNDIEFIAIKWISAHKCAEVYWSADIWNVCMCVSCGFTRFKDNKNWFTVKTGREFRFAYIHTHSCTPKHICHKAYTKMFIKVVHSLLILKLIVLMSKHARITLKNLGIHYLPHSAECILRCLLHNFNPFTV